VSLGFKTLFTTTLAMARVKVASSNFSVFIAIFENALVFLVHPKAKNSLGDVILIVISKTIVVVLVVMTQ